MAITKVEDLSVIAELDMIASKRTKGGCFLLRGICGPMPSVVSVGLKLSMDKHFGAPYNPDDLLDSGLREDLLELDDLRIYQGWKVPMGTFPQPKLNPRK